MKRQGGDLDLEHEAKRIKKSNESVHNNAYQKISKLVEIAKDFAEDEELFMLLLTKNFSNGIDDIDRGDRFKLFLKITRVLPSYREVMTKLLSKNFKKLIDIKVNLKDCEDSELQRLFRRFPDLKKWYEGIKVSLLRITPYEDLINSSELLLKFKNILDILSLSGCTLEEAESSLLLMFDYEKEEKKAAVRRALERICDEIILNIPIDPRKIYSGLQCTTPKIQPRISAFRELAMSLPKELHVELVIILKNKFKDLILKLDAEDRHVALFILVPVLPDYSSEILDIYEINIDSMLFNSEMCGDDRVLYIRDWAREEVMFPHLYRIMNIAIKYFYDIFSGCCHSEIPALADVMPAYSRVLLAESADQVSEIVEELKEKNIEEAAAFLCLNLPEKDEQVKAFIKIIKVLPCQEPKLKKLLFKDLDALASYIGDCGIEDEYFHDFIGAFHEELCSLVTDDGSGYVVETLEDVGAVVESNLSTGKLRISCSIFSESESESKSEIETKQPELLP